MHLCIDFGERDRELDREERERERERERKYVHACDQCVCLYVSIMYLLCQFPGWKGSQQAAFHPYSHQSRRDHMVPCFLHIPAHQSCPKYTLNSCIAYHVCYAERWQLANLNASPGIWMRERRIGGSSGARELEKAKGGEQHKENTPQKQSVLAFT